MSLNDAALIIGLLAAGLLLFLLGVAPALRRPIELFRLRRHSRMSENATTSDDWIYLPQARGEQPAETSANPWAEEETGVGRPNAGAERSPAVIEVVESGVATSRVVAERQSDGVRRASETEAARIVEDARRRANELLEEAELQAERIVVAAGRERARLVDELAQERADLERRTRLGAQSTVQEAARQAEELLVAAKQQCTSLVRKAEAEAQRKVAEITGDAERRARELLGEAEREAGRIAVDAIHERARLVEELARERSVLEETRTRLSGFLADSLEEVEAPRPESKASADARDDEALAVRTSAEADR